MKNHKHGVRQTFEGLRHPKQFSWSVLSISITAIGFTASGGGVQAQSASSPPQQVEITGALPRTAVSIPLDEPSASGSRLGLTPRETPATVDVITHEQMLERGNRTTEQALENAAGVISGQCFGLTCFSLRGFSNTNSLPFLFDGVRYPGLAFSPRGTFIFDRIEVIKGPASVLHGLGSVTGAINFITKPADGRSERELLLAVDNWRAVNLGVGLGGGDADGLAWRADYNHIDGDKGSSGWVDRTDYRYDHFAGELALRISPVIKLKLSGQVLEDGGSWYFGTPLVNGRIDERVRDRNYNVSDNEVNKRAGWLRAGAEFTLAPGWVLRNETYYNDEARYYFNAEVYEANAAATTVSLSDFLRINQQQRQIGNRTELSGEHRLFGMRHKVVLGYDYAVNKHERANNSPYAAPPVTVDFLYPVPVPFVTTSAFSPQRRTRLEQQALFAESWLALTERFKLSLSARRDELDLDSYDLRASTAFDRQYGATSWRVGGLFDITSHITAYAQVSRALEPPAQIVTLTAAQRNFNLTRARQFEVGLKGYLPGRVGEFTLAWFDITRSDILTRDPVNPALTVQIGEQSGKGIEFDITFRPTPQWAFGANGSVLSAQFDNFFERVGGQPVSRAGLLPPDVPERVANAFATWRSAGGAWRLNGNVRYVGKRTANNANTVTMDGYTTVDAGVAYALLLGGVQGELALHGRNLADKVYASRSYGGGSQVLLGEPRAFELSYRTRF